MKRRASWQEQGIWCPVSKIERKSSARSEANYDLRMTIDELKGAARIYSMYWDNPNGSSEGALGR